MFGGSDIFVNIDNISKTIFTKPPLFYTIQTQIREKPFLNLCNFKFERVTLPLLASLALLFPMPLSSSQCLLSSFLGSREDASTTRIKPTLVGEQQIHTFAKQLLPLHTTILFLFIVLKVSTTSLVIFYNKCPHQVWPRIQPSAGKLVLARGGFKLSPNWAYSLQLPDLWFGRLWGRHDCTFDIGGHGRYTTGDYDGPSSATPLAEAHQQPWRS